MRQVLTDDDERFIIPQQRQNLGHLFGRSAADDERNNGERSEHRLQEWQLDLEGMFGRVRLIIKDNLRVFGAKRLLSNPERSLQ